ncbi:hypothetical protein Hypma_007524 [Hypsizygus marmoreus]|uniref:Integrase core domain-containing protein n=1 Tax=Hypsizygus marmoreus TaxID=39966 RepID=A0A369JWZ7_HYPMA|nr:hypothetical protein Hypma_007524 [Hypsizygus marmoreus]
MPRKNQYKPLPPLETVAMHIIKYWKMRKTDKQILELLKEKHIDTNRYGLGLTRFIEMREKMGLLRTRKQDHDVESIRQAMIRLREQYPNAGAREMISLLFHEEDILVSRSVMTSYFEIYEPELIKQRRANRLRRKQFWAAGVNDILAVDQHDKWKYKFGLGLHTGIDPFAGYIHWIKVWWTNSNPRLILSYYLDTIEQLGFMPMVTQSDPGSENYGIANGHTFLRHWHDPSLVGTLQHRWMRQKKNVKPEIAWSQLRRRFTPGFEDLLDVGVNEAWYDPDDYLEGMTFRWIFIPWLQRELNAYKDRVNNTAKRADKNKILPHGVPLDIYESADRYGVLNFKIDIDKRAVQEARVLYAPPAHEVFELVPPTFSSLAAEFYHELGEPTVTRNTVWDVYLQLRRKFQQFEAIPPAVRDEWKTKITLSRNDVFEEMELTPNLIELPRGMDDLEDGGTYYMGGVNNGHGLGMYTFCFKFSNCKTDAECNYHIDEAMSAQLDEMMNVDEPMWTNEEEAPEMYVQFSDEESDDGDQW